ncbi:MAG: hypothetical protein JST16_06595 [Bdellovibrionales bacterium]|nr:hypothetical protein [Bdellovibrionales bacterium]
MKNLFALGAIFVLFASAAQANGVITSPRQVDGGWQRIEDKLDPNGHLRRGVETIKSSMSDDVWVQKTTQADLDAATSSGTMHCTWKDLVTVSGFSVQHCDDIDSGWLAITRAPDNIVLVYYEDLTGNMLNWVLTPMLPALAALKL